MYLLDKLRYGVVPFKNSQNSWNSERGFLNLLGKLRHGVIPLKKFLKKSWNSGGFLYLLGKLRHRVVGFQNSPNSWNFGGSAAAFLGEIPGIFHREKSPNSQKLENPGTLRHRSESTGKVPRSLEFWGRKGSNP